MSKRIVLISLVIYLFLLLSGCAFNRATAIVTNGTDLSRVKSFYVVEGHGDKDGYDVYRHIESNLLRRGYAVTTGPNLKTISNADAVITYEDRWHWDMSMYLLQLTITLKDPISYYIMARGNSLHTSLARKTTEEMVEEILTNIFKTKANGKEEEYE